MWAYMQGLSQECETDPVTESLDPKLSALIERGIADGTIDSTLPSAWTQNLLWALLYTAWEYIKQGTSKHDALDLTLQTLRKVIAPATSPGSSPSSR